MNLNLAADPPAGARLGGVLLVAADVQRVAAEGRAAPGALRRRARAGDLLPPALRRDHSLHHGPAGEHEQVHRRADPDQRRGLGHGGFHRLLADRGRRAGGHPGDELHPGGARRRPGRPAGHHRAQRPGDAALPAPRAGRAADGDPGRADRALGDQGGVRAAAGHQGAGQPAGRPLPDGSGRAGAPGPGDPGRERGQRRPHVRRGRRGVPPAPHRAAPAGHEHALRDDAQRRSERDHGAVLRPGLDEPGHDRRPDQPRPGDRGRHRRARAGGRAGRARRPPDAPNGAGAAPEDPGAVQPFGSGLPPSTNPFSLPGGNPFSGNP